MDKLIKLALASKNFAPEIMDNIVLVAEATDNKIVAIELLLGIYEYPVINPESVKGTQKDELTPRKFIKYDPIKDRVHFETNRKETKTFKFNSQEDMDNATNWDKAEELRIYKDSDYTKELSREIVTTSYCSLDRWQ